jgi:hypothetical protein
MSLYWDVFVVFGWSVEAYLFGPNTSREQTREVHQIDRCLRILCTSPGIVRAVTVNRLLWSGMQSAWSVKVNGLLWRNGRTSEDSIKVDFWGITNGYVKSIRLSQNDPKDGLISTRFGVPPPPPPRKHSCYSFLLEAESTPLGRIISLKNSNDTFGNRTRDLPACSAVPPTTAPTRAPQK